MRAVLGILFFVFIVFSMISATLVVLAVNTWAFDRDFYSDLLDDPVIYDAFLDSLPDYLESDAFQRNQADLEPEDRANLALAVALREVVTPEYLREQVTGVVDDFFVLLEADNPGDVNISVDLTPVKDRLQGSGQEAFVQSLAEALPECAPGQEPRAESGALIRCKSEGMTNEEAVQEIEEALPDFIESIPDTLVLNENIENSTAPLDTSIREAFNGAILTLLVFTVIFWFANALIGGVGRRQVFLWLAFTLMIPAFITLMSGVAMTGGVIDTAVRSIEDATIEFNDTLASEELRQALAEKAVNSLTRIGNGFLIVGAASTALAFLLLGLGLSSPRRTSSNVREVSVPA